jgi:putative ABC transport system permease protein
MTGVVGTGRLASTQRRGSRPGRLLRLSSARFFRQHPWQAALAVVGIALGVGVVVAVDLATSSSRRAFELSAEAVFGTTSHQVLPGPGGLSDTAYVRIRLQHAVDAAPVVEVRAAIESPFASRAVRLLGVDPFADAPFRPWTDARGDFDVAAVLTRPGALVLPLELADALSLAPGDSFTITVAGSTHDAWLAGILRPRDALSRRALSDLALADISTAQEIGGRIGRLDRIDLRLPADDPVLLDSIRATLPAGAQIIESGARTESTAAMTRAFELNLGAFTLITLAFGALLIYDVMAFSVVQRRKLIGLLRALGVTRREILRVLLREALLIGMLATVLGMALGVVLGAGLVRLVARTVNDLYFAVSVSGVDIGPLTILKAIALGVGATIAASIPAIREATGIAPRAALVRSVLESSARAGVRRAALAGLVLLVPSVALAIAPGRSILIGFVALFGVVGAAAFLAPAGTVVLMRVLRPLAARVAGTAGSMAVRGVTATLSRTGPAVAALMVAVSIGAAVGIMITSFRGSVERWLGTSLVADIYVASPSPGTRGEGTLDPAAIASIRDVPGIAGISTYRHADIIYGDGDIRIVAVDLFAPHRTAFTFIDADADDAWVAFDGGALLVSESFAYRHSVGAGDTVILTTDTGPRTFPVAATYRDYASEFGILFLDRRAWNTFWNDAAISSLAVFADDEVDADALLERIRERTAAHEPLYIRSNRGLRDATLEVFDRTFAITGVLRALALIVAFVGVLSALMALQLERAHEIGVLRATGLTPRQVGALVTSQTGLLGLAAGILAVPLALVLAWLLIHVINRRSFGWSVDMVTDTSGIAAAVAVAIIAALLAGIYPAWRMSRTPPAAALRNE